ncbi:MAG: hypothetical protein EX258_00400 [Sphingomonadaceae bacterium]|nr:MAG: hypothetical protein EX258_00400 [Sphingomonadaceae bacterium]
MNKIAGLIVIPAAALVMVGGWAFWAEALGEGTGMDGLTEHVDQRIDSIDRAVERVDRTVDRVDQLVEQRVEAVDRIVEANDRRIDAIDRAVSRSVDGANPDFTRALDRLQVQVDAGELTQREAVRQAVQVSMDSGAEVPQSIARTEEELARTKAEAAQQIADSKAQIGALRESGAISQEHYSRLLAKVSGLEQRLEVEAPVRNSQSE